MECSARCMPHVVAQQGGNDITHAQSSRWQPVIDLLSSLGEKVAARLTPIVCEDRQLTLNIAHRIRDGFLHTRFPLLQELDGEPHHWATDDPRLVQIVQTTRKEIQL